MGARQRGGREEWEGESPSHSSLSLSLSLSLSFSLSLSRWEGESGREIGARRAACTGSGPRRPGFHPGWQGRRVAPSREPILETLASTRLTDSLQLGSLGSLASTRLPTQSGALTRAGRGAESRRVASRYSKPRPTLYLGVMTISILKTSANPRL